MSDQYVEPVILPLLVVDMIRYYRQFYFGDKIMVMYSGEYSDTHVVGVFNNAYSIIAKMVFETNNCSPSDDDYVETNDCSPSDCSDDDYVETNDCSPSDCSTSEHIEILGWYINYNEYANNQLFLSFPITELLLLQDDDTYYSNLYMVYIDSDKNEKTIMAYFRWFNINDINYSHRRGMEIRDHPGLSHQEFYSRN
jgi:hypothetical protein